MQDREAEFYHELSRLRDKEVFEVGEFSAFVDNIRETVSCHLHNLMMKGQKKLRIWPDTTKR